MEPTDDLPKPGPAWAAALANEHVTLNDNEIARVAFDVLVSKWSSPEEAANRIAERLRITHLADIERLFPDAEIERVGNKRRELVIYTGLAVAVDDDLNDRYDLPLVKMGED